MLYPLSYEGIMAVIIDFLCFLLFALFKFCPHSGQIIHRDSFRSRYLLQKNLYHCYIKNGDYPHFLDRHTLCVRNKKAPPIGEALLRKWVAPILIINTNRHAKPSSRCHPRKEEISYKLFSTITENSARFMQFVQFLKLI